MNLWKSQQGQLIILGLILMGTLATTLLAFVSGSLVFQANSAHSIEVQQAINLAEAGINKAIASLNASGGSYNGESEANLESGSYSVEIIDKDANTKIIESTGYVPNKQNPRVKKIARIQVSKGNGVAFNYGVQAGEGGIEMSNNTTINGSVYSNGNITMSNNAVINGDAYVAGGVQPNPDQQTDCTLPNCQDYLFGKNVSGENRLDVAQSFRPSTTSKISKVALKLKKVGSPPNITVRILGDQNGNPNRNNVLALGILYANLVTNEYSFIEVAFTTNPTLQADTPYWILIDTSGNNTNYWVWSLDTTQGYTRGAAKYSPDWQAGNPQWNNISGDLGFKTYIGGVATYIVGATSSQIQGDAHANTLKNLRISGDAYYQVSENITATNYYPGSPDPPVQSMPISPANIQNWKEIAQAGGVQTGDINNCPSRLSIKKYVGSISLPNLCNVTVESPIWITGNLNLSSGNTLKLDSAYGSSSGVIIVDGFITIGNNNQIQGSGSPGSYLLLISEFDSSTDPLQQPAIRVTNNGNSGLLYANLGIIDISNNNNLTEVTGWKLRLQNNVTVNYDRGLASAFFSSGPSGAFSVIKGTYQLE